MITGSIEPVGRWRALAVLAAALVLSMATWFSASAVLPQVRGEWNLSTSAGSWLTIAVQIGFVAGALVSAVLNLADVVPRAGSCSSVRSARQQRTPDSCSSRTRSERSLSAFSPGRPWLRSIRPR